MSSLTSTALLPLASSLLPTSSPTLSHPTSALGLLIHAIHTATGFRLVLPRPESTPSTSAGEGGAAESNSDSEVKNRLPVGWERDGSPKFTYRHDNSSLEFVISINEVGGRAIVNAVAVEVSLHSFTPHPNPRNPTHITTIQLQDHKSLSFDFLLTDYFSLSSFPFSLSSESSLQNLFSIPARLTDLITLYRISILQPLIPGLTKPGYEELPSSASPASGGASGSGSGGGLAGTGQNPPAGGGRLPPLGNPRGPYYPDAGGPDPLRLPGTGGMGRGSPNPFNIGRSDLDPLGGAAPRFPGFPGTDFDPLGGRGGGGIGAGGGMYMGPDHPLFRERFGVEGQGGRGGGGGGVWGGDGYLPRGGAPPGARFDPIGPTNGPLGGNGVGVGGFGGGNGIGSFRPNNMPPPQGQGGGGGGRGAGPLGRLGGGNDPDWDDAPPPGNSGNDYDAMFG